MKKYKPKFTEKIDGGLADNLSIKDIAEKHNVEFSVILDQIEKGIQVEYEHTNNFDIAKEIAMDHLVEYPYYYDELEQMEKKFEYITGNTMKRYERKFKEEDKDGNGIPDWLDDKISDVLEQLRDGNFGNAEGRQQFLDLITTLFNSKDKRARKSFKAISDLFSEIGDELVKYGLPVEGEEFEESLFSNADVMYAKKQLIQGLKGRALVKETKKSNIKEVNNMKKYARKFEEGTYITREVIKKGKVKNFIKIPVVFDYSITKHSYQEGDTYECSIEYDRKIVEEGIKKEIEKIIIKETKNPKIVNNSGGDALLGFPNTFRDRYL